MNLIIPMTVFWKNEKSNPENNPTSQIVTYKYLYTKYAND